MPLNAAFWKCFSGLVRSDPATDDSTRIRAALPRPRFHRRLEIAAELRVEGLPAEWNNLTIEPEESIERARRDAHEARSAAWMRRSLS